MKKEEALITGHVIVVTGAIIYIYASTVIVFVNQWFGIRSSPGVINAFLFTCLSIICIFNYLLAMCLDPGRVPPSFVPDIEDSLNHPIHEIKRKGGDLRYCKKCSLYKPPRSHHCRICKRCVLRMDHHCVWMNNCVGHANYKAFIVFVVYALLACIYSLILLVGSLTVEPQQSRGSYRTIYIISGLLLIPLSMALGVFLGWHIYLTIQNKTTIEYYEGVRAMLLAEQGGNVYSHPYDLGVYENLITVLGPNILCWVCPVSGYIGSGLRFRTIYDHIHAASAS
uniref:probable protein S-acyltransferase 16 n=1 Tax=Erigeron canadensis TaxID=72917 RepID=UPI001CB8EDDA|nr:probable protein S-acyltransferase 16 [Erigeron canadensis]